MTNKINIGDQYYLIISIDNQPFYISPSSFSLYITQSVLTKLPVLKLNLRNDPTGRLTHYFQVSDGISITTEIGRESDQTRKIKNSWRMFGPPKFSPAAGGMNVEIIAILDSMDFLNKQVPQSYSNMPTSAIIDAIANSLGFKTSNYRGENTIDRSIDTQTWRPTTRKYAEFVDHITRHAYNSNSSVFVTCVDEEKTLYFKELTSLIGVKPKGIFTHNVRAQSSTNQVIYPILDYKIKSNAGPLNSHIGFAFKTLQESLGGLTTSLVNTQITLPSNFIELNKNIKDLIGEGNSLFEYRPLDCGNVHSNTEKAYYQNKRIKALYSSGFDVLTETLTNEDILSPVSFDITDPVTRESNAMYRGIYLVSAKTRCIVGSRYYEKFSLVAAGRAVDDFDRVI